MEVKYVEYYTHELQMKIQYMEDPHNYQPN